MSFTSKKWRVHKNQLRDTNGRFGMLNELKTVSYKHENIKIEENLTINEWGDEEDSGWEDEIALHKERTLKLVWKDITVLEK